MTTTVVAADRKDEAFSEDVRMVVRPLRDTVRIGAAHEDDGQVPADDVSFQYCTG